jgi:TnpA family transposase
MVSKGGIMSMEANSMTQQERFEAAQAAVKAFMVKHGNVALLGETKIALKVKEAFYRLQDAAAEAYWTDEMEYVAQGRKA